jgi:hypothetical protein
MYSAPIGKNADGSTGGPVVLTLSCSDNGTDVSVAGFTPLKTFPQPQLTIQIGKSQTAIRPNLLVDGTSGLADLRIEFHITDSVLSEIEIGSEVRMMFDVQEQVFPAPPIPIREEFVNKCRSLVPSFMRKG